MRKTLAPLAAKQRIASAYVRAAEICDDDVETCRRIGVHGLALLQSIAAKKRPGERLNVLTHCNAGWLACVDWGTATSPIYHAHDAGLPIHVWVDETRPRNQGASLTAFELNSHGVPHTIIADNAGGHLMQKGEVDLCIVGTDRVTANGDVANKIGTYLKALAAKDNGVPFYVALPYSTIDWTLDSGSTIPIEERSADEVLKMPGRLPDGQVVTIDICSPGSPAANPAFDVTPARLVSGFITERGVCEANREGLLNLYPEQGQREGQCMSKKLGRQGRAQGRHRNGARYEPFRSFAGTLGQRVGPPRRWHADHSDRDGLRANRTRRHRARRGRRQRARKAAHTVE